MSALLSSEIGNSDKVVQYINEARELGLEVLPPDVNESGFKFTVVGEGRVRFGLGAIKNVGGSAIESIIAGRQAGEPYRTLVDLCERIDLRLCNKRVIEALIDSGACDSLGGHRAQLVAALDHAFAEAQARQAERDSGQHPLFGGETPAPRPPAPPPDVLPWSEHDRLAREKAVLGFFISGHPLAKYRAEVELFGTRTTATLGRWSDQRVRVAVVVTVVKRQISKKSGAEYARLVLEDFHGTAAAAYPGLAPGVSATTTTHPGLAPGVSAAAPTGREPGGARLRSRSLRVEAGDDLLAALRGLLGPDHVHLVRTT